MRMYKTELCNLYHSSNDDGFRKNEKEEHIAHAKEV